MLKASFLVVFTVCGVANQAFAQTPKVEDIVAKVEARKLPKSSKAEVLLTINKDGSKVEKVFKVLNLKESDEATYSLIEFVKPTATKILVHGRKKGEDDRWLKTSSGQPKRISASAEDQSFSQSHFDYSDLQFAKGTEFKHELICEPKCEVDWGGAPHYKVKSTPKSEGKKYAYTINFIRVADFLPVKIESYGKDGKVQKELIMEDLKDVKGYLTPMKVTAKISGTNNFSTMTIQSIDVDRDDIKKQQFDKNVL
jgi:hypothetical protein